MYRVVCHDPNFGLGSRVYYVREFAPGDPMAYDRSPPPEPGCLSWFVNWAEYDYLGRHPVPGSIPLGRTGGLADTVVTPEEAEAITGLHMPAAMDRLRELVHESSSTGVG